MLQGIFNIFSESLGPEEIELLRHGLPYSMNIGSAPFRQQLHSCMKCVLVRARDSSLVMLRTRDKQPVPLLIQQLGKGQSIYKCREVCRL